nr:MAG TPA: hypothetical protein [Caudoviricetes sp.]
MCCEKMGKISVSGFGRRSMRSGATRVDWAETRMNAGLLCMLCMLRVSGTNTRARTCARAATLLKLSLLRVATRRTRSSGLSCLL